MTKSLTIFVQTLQTLHWLTVRQRPEYKILTVTYKAVYGCVPSHVSDLAKPSQPLRSSNELHLVPAT